MNRHVLFMSLRSPFARRIRLRLEELELPYETEVLDVFNPPAWFYSVNPLGRVPVLKLPNGQFIVDSYEIDAYLAARFANHSIYSSSEVSEVRTRNWIGLATGLMEHVVAKFLEERRSPGLVNLEMTREMREAVDRTLRYFSLEVRGPYLAGERLGVWDFDLGSALEYCDLRLGHFAIDRYPTLRDYLERLKRLPRFAKTAPPA